jgi:PAS domain S-box-containing protein
MDRFQTDNEPVPNEAEFRNQLRRSTLTIVFALGIPLFILLGLVAFLQNSARWVDHSDQVIAEANNEEKLLVKMQSDFRGYRLMDDKSILALYLQTGREIDPHFLILENLVSDNTKQHDLAVQFHAEADSWIKLSQNYLDHMSAGPLSEGDLAYLQATRKIINEAVATAEIFINAEGRLRFKREQLRENVMSSILAAFTVLFLAGIPLLAFWIQKQLKNVGGLYQASLAETSRRATELQVTLNSIGDALIATNAGGKVEFLNPVAELLTGWSNADARGLELAEIFHIFNEETGAIVDNPVARVLRENVVVGLANHTVLHAKDGRELPIEDSAAPIRNLDGKILGVILVFHDVSLKRADERKLAEAEWRARIALEVGGAGSWVWDILQDRVTGDTMLARTFGVPYANCVKGEPIGSFINAVYQDDRPQLEAAVQQTINTGEPYQCEYRVTGADGVRRWVHARGKIEEDKPGKSKKLLGFMIDITDRKNIEQTMAESRESFRVLTEVVEIQVWTAKPNGELDYANQQCVEYFAADLERDILGNAWGQYVHPEDLPKALQRWQKSLATGERYEVEFRLRAGSGAFRWFLVRARPLRDIEGRIAKWFGTNTDIHELKLAQDAAAQASRAKDDFLAALSHELRTPLTPVLMTAVALHEDERLPADVREQLGMMERNISLEARLIDDLLDLTAISRGKLPLRTQACDAHSLIGLAIEIIREEAMAKEISIEREFAARNSGLSADPARFQQVIWNLLRNAIKFTPRGGHVAIRTHDEGGNWLRIEITDSGIGIDISVLDKIFLPFEQAKVTGDHRFGGVGLGLSIARAIIEMHHGTIQASSAGSNQGATFTVKLPGAMMPPHGASDTSIRLSAEPKVEAANQNNEFNRQYRLLLVEDHKPTLQVISGLLRRDGYEVNTAGTVSDALRVASVESFDLVISDLGLPDGTGIQLMQQLRGLYQLKGVALTGFGMEEDVTRSQDAGFIAHIIKPVHMIELRRIIRGILKTPKPSSNSE